jgi:hypothetical protein
MTSPSVFGPIERAQRACGDPNGRRADADDRRQRLRLASGRGAQHRRVDVADTNSVALRCTAYFGAARLRAGGVAAIESITWGESWMPA